MARALLLLYRWNTKKAIDDFWNQGPQGIFDFDPDADDIIPTCCDSCYDEFTPKKENWVAISECKHYLCRDCYTYYLSNEVSKGPECAVAHCPHATCHMIVPSEIFQRLLMPQEFKKYTNFCVQYYVNES